MHKPNLRATSPTKGQRTADRVLDVAEELFARQGYAGTSLREIAEAAGLRQPGLYNHFDGKRGLYEAVLQRAFAPLAEIITTRLEQAAGLHDFTELPLLISEQFARQPHQAALMQQAIQSADDGAGQRFIQEWMRDLFEQGLHGTEVLGLGGEDDRQTMAMNVIAMFSLSTGYFLARRPFQLMTGTDIDDPDNITRHKRLLHKVIRAMLIS